MLIDCDRCVARGAGCDDCVISVLLGPPDQPVEFDPAERVALVRLADAGLLPPRPLQPERRTTRSA
jgi:hypothetical protein